jgi:calcium-dependent protein kinase
MCQLLPQNACCPQVIYPPANYIRDLKPENILLE